MPVSVATRRPSAPSSPSSRTSMYTSSYSSSTSRYSSLTRSSVTSLDLTPSRYTDRILSDRLASSSLSRSVRHDDSGVVSRYSSRERSLEPRASLCSAADTSSRASREGSKSRLDSSTAARSSGGGSSSSGSAYMGSSSGSKLGAGRPPLHSSLSTSASSAALAEDAGSRSGSTTASSYARSRSTGVTGGAAPVATMTTSTGKPFHSRFLKPKPAAEDKPADKELARDEVDDARNNNTVDMLVDNGARGVTCSSTNGADGDDHNGNDSRRPSVALLRQRFDVAASPAPSPAPSPASSPTGSPAPAPVAASGAANADGKSAGTRPDQDHPAGAVVGGHEEVGSRRLAAGLAASSDSDNYESPRLGRRAPANTSNGTRGSGLNGLRNIGNTCFMNSVIQCLSNTRPLLEYLLKQTYLSEINTTNSSMKGALMKAFAKMIEELWTGEGQIINTSAFKGQIQHFAPRFMGYSQQDAQEFLRYLLEGLHEDVNRVEQRPSNTVLPDIDDSLNDNQKAEESWRRYLRIDNSSVVDAFVGQLKSTLQCTVCGHCSVTFDPFWDLSLPIPSRTGQLRLQQCLEHFTREEVLDGDEKPTCAKCQTRRKCTKSFSIQKFPKILVLHLKRFSPMERFRGKLSVTVEFPLNGLDLSAYAANRGRGCTYNLYGVANHSGTTYSGHYTAYCRHPYTHEWHEYNDSRVSSISARNVVSSEAYVLFYELSGHTSHL